MLNVLVIKLWFLSFQPTFLSSASWYWVICLLWQLFPSRLGNRGDRPDWGEVHAPPYVLGFLSVFPLRTMVGSSAAVCHFLTTSTTASSHPFGHSSGQWSLPRVLLPASNLPWSSWGTCRFGQRLLLRGWTPAMWGRLQTPPFLPSALGLVAASRSQNLCDTTIAFFAFFSSPIANNSFHNQYGVSVSVWSSISDWTLTVILSFKINFKAK